MRKNSTAIYRTLLREAWLLAWHRKTLWIFGIFAAIVSTGGVFDVAMSAMQRSSVGSGLWTRILDSSFGGTAILTQLGGSTHIFLMLILAAGFLFLAVLSQTALVHGIKSPTHQHPNIVRKRAHDHLGRIFILDVITKILSGVLLVLLTTSSARFAVTFLQLLIFFFAILIIQILSVLSIIHVIETDATISETIVYAWSIFSKHALATFEYALILFVLIALSGFGLIILLVVLSVPYAFLYSVSLLTGSSLLFFLSNAFSGLFVLLMIILLGGFLVTFQYSAWYVFYKQTHHPMHKRRPLSKIARLFIAQ